MASDSPLLISAPGKVILYGEHAVVYGKPALAASVDLRCYALFVPSIAPTLTLHLPNLSMSQVWPLTDLTTSNEHLRELAGVDNGAPSTTSMACLAFLENMRGLEVTVVATLPAGAGLGSSAAYSVCLAAGLLTLTQSIRQSPPDETLDSPLSETPHSVLPDDLTTKLEQCGLSTSGRRGWSESERELINKWGFEAERLLHGQPSGIDNSISSYGGAIYFKSGDVSHLKSMPQLKVLLVNTQVPRSTKKMVAIAKERLDKFPAIVNRIFDAIEDIVLSAQDLLIINSSCDSHVTKSLQELCDVNHHLLNALGVGHPQLDSVCEVLSKHGLKGKLTGAGGGGCVLALIPSDVSDVKVCEVRALLRDAGCESWCTQVGATGVCSHPLDKS